MLPAVRSAYRHRTAAVPVTDGSVDTTRNATTSTPAAGNSAADAPNAATIAPPSGPPTIRPNPALNMLSPIAAPMSSGGTLRPTNTGADTTLSASKQPSAKASARMPATGRLSPMTRRPLRPTHAA